MYRVVKKRLLAPAIALLEVEAPAVAAKVEPGQFVIVRVNEWVSVFRLLSWILTEKRVQSLLSYKM